MFESLFRPSWVSHDKVAAEKMNVGMFLKRSLMSYTYGSLCSTVREEWPIFGELSVNPAKYSYIIHYKSVFSNSISHFSRHSRIEECAVMVNLSAHTTSSAAKSERNRVCNNTVLFLCFVQIVRNWKPNSHVAFSFSTATLWPMSRRGLRVQLVFGHVQTRTKQSCHNSDVFDIWRYCLGENFVFWIPPSCVPFIRNEVVSWK